MPKILQLSAHVANLIAAGEVVERPASAVKELLENAVDAGASQVTVEIRDGGMTFLRVTDNGCGMSREDARMAFRRHATSKLHNAEDLAAISTMGFRGEALAAIASVSRIDLMTKTAGAVCGTSLHLEAGNVTEEEEVGCPEGTTILVRDLFYNTPARMKFMKSDTVEGARVAAAVQMQALAHPEVAFRFLRDGKQCLSTPGDGELRAAVYSVLGRDCARMVPVDSKWDAYRVTGFVALPTDARPSRSMQIFFVNDRPVKSKLLTSALEEAYRNRLMVGKFPACILHVTLPASAVDVNVHPAKTEVKFLSEKAAFDCVHYGVLAALNRQTDRPEVHFSGNAPRTAEPERSAAPVERPAASAAKPAVPLPEKKDTFFQSMSAQEFRAAAEKSAPGANAARQVPPVPVANAPRQVPNGGEKKWEHPANMPLREYVVVPGMESTPAPVAKPAPPVPVLKEEVVQQELPMPEPEPWRLVGELYRTYILVEQGENAYLIDKHAAHERILFDKLKANQEKITPQLLMMPVSVSLRAEEAAELLANGQLLGDLGFSLEEFGENTVLARQIPMDLGPEQAAEALEELAAKLLDGRKETRESVRDDLLHTVACKAAIKAGWVTSDRELRELAGQVMEREDLKYCPHGRPICVSLSKKQLEKQFRRT